MRRALPAALITAAPPSLLYQQAPAPYAAAVRGATRLVDGG